MNTPTRRTAHLFCAAAALSLNAAFAWAAVEATATVPPLRSWQAPAPLAADADPSAPMQTIRVAALGVRAARAALVQ